MIRLPRSHEPERSGPDRLSGKDPGLGVRAAKQVVRQDGDLAERSERERRGPLEHQPYDSVGGDLDVRNVLQGGAQHRATRSIGAQQGLEGCLHVEHAESMPILPFDAGAQVQGNPEAVRRDLPAIGQLGPVVTARAWRGTIEERFVDQPHHDLNRGCVWIAKRIQVRGLAVEVYPQRAATRVRRGGGGDVLGRRQRGRERDRGPTRRRFARASPVAGARE